MGKAANLVGGFSLLGAGVAMLVLPGPGVVAIAGGLTLLGRELPWAKRITDDISSKLGRAGGTAPGHSVQEDETV
jgi:hypothetical protein